MKRAVHGATWAYGNMLQTGEPGALTPQQVKRIQESAAAGERLAKGVSNYVASSLVGGLASKGINAAAKAALLRAAALKISTSPYSRTALKTRATRKIARKIIAASNSKYAGVVSSPAAGILKHFLDVMP